jgi:hypothetical protein
LLYVNSTKTPSYDYKDIDATITWKYFNCWFLLKDLPKFAYNKYDRLKNNDVPSVIDCEEYNCLEGTNSISNNSEVTDEIVSKRKFNILERGGAYGKFKTAKLTKLNDESVLRDVQMKQATEQQVKIISTKLDELNDTINKCYSLQKLKMELKYAGNASLKQQLDNIE